ncbi:MAG: aminoacetone oxidase family FAD-binding enzyme [Fimbriimonadaceae bacterium]|nr:aminoacetone oxidase family FAD-binding enzyme [Fimbriimonadaceae bacterium]
MGEVEPDVVVVGAGAAGILASLRAAELGAKVRLYEKNNRIGIKILVSGGGKCNITHDGEVEDVLRAFRPKEARFLRPSFYRYTNRDIVDLLVNAGLEVYTRPDGRIFPTKGDAKQVVRILGDRLVQAGVDVRLSAPVSEVLFDELGVQGLVAGGTHILCPRIVLSVGGSSYPASGTTGDGWPWAKAMGHTIEKIRPALAPIVTDPEPAFTQGLSLQEVCLKARQAGKVIEKWTGDMVFTRHGVSGPCVLGVSRVVAERMSEGKISLEVDLAQANSFEQLHAILDAFIAETPRKTLGEFVRRFAPEALSDSVLEKAGYVQGTVNANFSKKVRNKLIELIKAWPLGNVHHVPIEKGEVVAGGVSLDEVDPHTMRSLKMRGLYLCGEILDIAGPIGGYNLQAAWSSGYVAGETAANDALEG